MSSKDTKGYYKALGVQPDAPASVVKAAYRALAMDLHPDRNPAKDATAKFQKIQEAYATLSDAKLREQYDADSSVPRADATSSAGNYKPFDPIVCSKCNAISAQPRYKVFHVVYGYLFGATKTPRQGVFCSKCEIKVALQSSAITLVAGWWSIHGFFWTLLPR
jgi:DnaJ-class molecular chaperone